MEYIRADMTGCLAAGGISGGVLEAMNIVPRHLFVSEALRYGAYRDMSLPIGFGQTISKPSVIAKMVQALSLIGEERVLEIGTGSGYQTAILSLLASSVVSIERIEALAHRACGVLHSLGILNAAVFHTDDFRKTEGAFDAIIVSAGADIFPVELCGKLNPGGRLVIPVGNGAEHLIMRYIRKADGTLLEESIGAATFVPYIAALSSSG